MGCSAPIKCSEGEIRTKIRVSSKPTEQPFTGIDRASTCPHIGWMRHPEHWWMAQIPVLSADDGISLSLGIPLEYRMAISFVMGTIIHCTKQIWSVWLSVCLPVYGWDTRSSFSYSNANCIVASITTTTTVDRDRFMHIFSFTLSLLLISCCC